MVCLALSCQVATDPPESAPAEDTDAPEVTPTPSEPGTPPAWGDPEPLTLDPGRVTLHRLNNRELDLSLQPMLGTELSLGERMPADPLVDGFDNNADALTLGSLHVEVLEAGLTDLVADGLRPPVFSQTTRHEVEDAAWSGGGLASEIGGWNSGVYGVSLYPGADQSRFLTVDHAGTYAVRLRACHELYGAGVGPEAPLEFVVNGTVLGTVTVVADENVSFGNHCKLDMQTYDAGAVTLPEGEVEMTVSTVDYGMVGVDWVELEGPLGATGALPPGRAKIYVCDPAPKDEPDLDCVRDIFEAFVEEAWRRPVTPAELDAVMLGIEDTLQSGGDVHEAISRGVKRVLLSPAFLFRPEVPSSPEATVPELLSAHALASRLSFFLWSRHPDEALLARATDQSLLTPEVLAAETRRMLADERAEALVDGFGAHWMGLPELDAATPDPAGFPTFDEELRSAMALELRDLMRRVITGELDMKAILTADQTWVAPALADHYGLDGVSEAAYVAVPGRGAGVLSTGAFLTLSSNPTRTSPVRRGNWVLKNLLCEEAPPPPDGVEQAFDESPDAASIPEQLAAHRANPACASCHDRMDPVGIALESFDAIGAPRTTYPDGTSVETASALTGIGSFDDITELSVALADQEATHRCMVEKTATYALGRTTRAEDWPYLQEVEASFVSGGYTFEALVVALVQSELFRSHRGGTP